jgi:predicted transcriptional regulator
MKQIRNMQNEINRLYSTGLTMEQVGDLLGISRWSVQKYVRNSRPRGTRPKVDDVSTTATLARLSLSVKEMSVKIEDIRAIAKRIESRLDDDLAADRASIAKVAEWSPAPRRRLLGIF